MRNNHIIIFILFIGALIFREFLFDIIIDQLRTMSFAEAEYPSAAIDSIIRFLHIGFISVYLFALFYLIKFLRGNIFIKIIPLLILTHLMVNNPSLYFVESSLSLANPYLFTLISASIMTGLFIYSEREYLYNSLKPSVNPFFDTALDVLGFLALIMIPFLANSLNYGFIPYIFYSEYPDPSNLLILSFLPLGFFTLLGLVVVVYEGHFKSYYLYRLIVLIGLSFLYLISDGLGFYDNDLLYNLHTLGLWLLTLIYVFYFSQVSLSPFSEK